MKVIISLGGKELIIEPQTEFEKDIMLKYFNGKDIKASIRKDGTLSIKWVGPAASE
jgi:hypothetical protein